MKTSEAEIEKYLVSQVEKIGGKAYKGNPFGQRGFMDRICIFPGGWVIFVEVKAPGRRPRPNQRAMIKRFKQMGFNAVWVDTRAKINKLIKWQLKYHKEHRVMLKEYICNRQDCPLRRIEA